MLSHQKNRRRFWVTPKQLDIRSHHDNHGKPEPASATAPVPNVLTLLILGEPSLLGWNRKKIMLAVRRFSVKRKKTPSNTLRFLLEYLRIRMEKWPLEKLKKSKICRGFLYFCEKKKTWIFFISKRWIQRTKKKNTKILRDNVVVYLHVDRST